MAGIDAAAVTALADALAVARGGSTGNTEENNVAQAIADMVLKAIVDPGGGPPPLTAPAGGGAVTGTGGLL